MSDTPTRVVKVSKLKPHTEETESRFLSVLKDIQPSAVFFSSHSTLSTSCTGAPPALSTPVVRKLPLTLPSLQKPKYSAMNDAELRDACKDVFATGMFVTHEEVNYLEESTRLQSQSLLWFQHRSGRITASKFFAVKRASLDPPPTSLVKQLMERSTISSHVPALRWGIDNEDVARQTYIETVSNNHQCTAAGLHVNPSYPHLGATPDGVLNCDCCDKGFLRLSALTNRKKHPHDVTDPWFYLKRDEDGQVYLSPTHVIEYYYQN